MCTERSSVGSPGLPGKLPVVCAVILAAIGMSLGTEPEKPGSEAEAGLTEQVRELYEKAKEMGADVPADLYEWVKQDIQNIGDWEYQVLELGSGSQAVQARLNDLGNERWELVWVERDGEALRLYLKRPVRSYLRQIPLSQLLKMLSGSADAGSPEG